MDPTSETRLGLVYPQLATLQRTLAANLAAKWGDGCSYRITQGMRTWAEQHVYWLQGRTDLTTVNQARSHLGLGSIPADQNFKVTDADEGESWHNYGLATDGAPFTAAGLPIWDEKDSKWNDIVQEGEALGMRSGISWKDEPHLELTHQYPADPPQVVKDLYNQAGGGRAGLIAVWNSLVVNPANV